MASDDDVSVDETEYAGAMKFRFLDVTINNYQSGGHPFSSSDIPGMNRLQDLQVHAKGGTYVVNFDNDNDTLTVSEGGSEVAGGTTVNARAIAIGR